MDETAAPAPPAAPRSIGERLRAGRERSGLSIAAAAEKLHLDAKVIEALEADRFAELGASVYVRGHLRRYADFVGEPGAELVSSYSARDARPPPPDLTQIPHAERRADPRRLVTPLVGLWLCGRAAGRHLVGSRRLAFRQCGQRIDAAYAGGSAWRSRQREHGCRCSDAGGAVVQHPRQPRPTRCRPQRRRARTATAAQPKRDDRICRCARRS